MNVRLTFRVTGRVQGVWFRAHTEQQARARGLTGWVRNELDGSVIGCAEGARSRLDELAAWLREGSPKSRVDVVELGWGEATGEFADFGVRR